MSQTTPWDHDALMKKALIELRELRAKLQRLEQAQRAPIAVIGMGCRFPGAENPQDFWGLLRNGVDAITEVPQARWNVDAYYDPDPTVPGKMYTRYGGFLAQSPTLFDAEFFGIAPREALSLDPQQRLLLEVSWEALEHAALAPVLPRTGVFIGISTIDYYALLLQQRPRTAIDAYLATGTTHSVAAGRLSYLLGVQGPALAVDTACSSSLVAVHLALTSLRQRECDVALAGGVNWLLAPDLFINLCQARMLAADGRCKTFAAAANGFGRSEGCGMVVLKRLDDAIAAGDNILAVLRGSAVNQDGRSSGLTAPNGPAQQAVIRAALENSGVTPSEVSYVEAHGTGTPLGDPIEVGSLGAVFGPERAEPLLLGSVKTNIGHLEAAAGIAGLIKVVLALQHEELPPHLHLHAPNPHIPWDELPVTVPTKRLPWSGDTRLAGVSSFGFSGTNVHVVLEAAPVGAPRPAEVARPQHLLTLSAKSKHALQELAARYAARMQTQPRTDMADMCFTAHTGRVRFPHRLGVVAASLPEMQAKLADFAAGKDGVITGQAPEICPKIAFLCTGQGAQYVGMGRQLYETQPTFRHVLERCDALLRPVLEQPLLDVLYPATATPAQGWLDQTIYTQPALFAVEYALAALWQSWGITPSVVLGHSVGEYTAACVAGVFSLEEGLKLIAARGRLMQALPQDGTMVAVLASEARVAEALRPHADEVAIAAVNGPRSVVLSGRSQAVQAVVTALQADGIPTRPLTVSHAFHSPLMEPMLAEFDAAARGMTYAAPRLTLVSNVSGSVASAAVATPDYWGSHVRQTVRFADGIRTVHELGCDIFVEIGPQPTLLAMGRQCLPDDAGMWLPSLRQGQEDWQQLLTSLAALYAQGVAVDWAGFDRDSGCRKVALPTYPFQRQRYWALEASQPQAHTALRPLIDTMTRSPLVKETVCETRFSVATKPFLTDHRVYDEVVASAACHLSLGLSAAELAFGASAYELRDIVFPAALVLPEETERTVQVVLAPQERGQGSTVAASLHIVSFVAEAPAEHTTHAVGSVVAGAGLVPPPGSLSAWQARCRQELQSTALYEVAHTRRLHLGPSYQWHAALWRGDGEALSRMRRPDVVGSMDGYVLHHGLIDACLQLPFATVPQDAPAQTWLPFAIKAVRVYGAVEPQEKAWWGYVKQVGAQRWDMQLLHESGRVLAEISGFEARQAAPQALQATEPWRGWLYHVQWQPQAHEEPSLPVETRHSVRPWLIFADAAGLGADLAARLRAGGETPMLVRPGASYASVGEQTYHLDADAAADYRQLLRAVPDVQGVVCLWSIDTPWAETTVDLEQAAERVCGQVLYIVQALVAECAQLPKLWLVTRGAQAVSPDEGVASMAQAPLWGLGKVIALEHPDLHCVRLDLDPAAQQDAVESLWTEIMAPAAAYEDQVALRHGSRHVARLIRQSVPGNTEASVREDRSYLITGGLGGLGLHVARWLVTQGARHLILTGRRGPNSAAQEAIAQLQQAGAQVHVARADVSQQTEVGRVLDMVASLMPPLGGIVHAAGVLDDGVVSEQNRERLRQVMAPKVAGTWNLHVLTQSLALDFFVCFSSAAALLGAPGQGNYAAANAFMDALAHQRRAQGLPGLSINWGLWAEVGMAAELTSGARQRLTAQGWKFIAPEQGLQVLKVLLGQTMPQVGVLPVDWSTLCAQFAPGATPFLVQVCPTSGPRIEPSATLLHQLEAAPVHERRPLLAAYLCSQVAAALGMHAAADIEPRQRFFDLGMDSLMALQLKNRLEPDLGCALPQTLFFDYPTVETLADYLTQEVLDLDFTQPAELAQQQDETRATPHPAEMERLSEAEAEELLLKELEKLHR